MIGVINSKKNADPFNPQNPANHMQLRLIDDLKRSLDTESSNNKYYIVLN